MSIILLVLIVILCITNGLDTSIATFNSYGTYSYTVPAGVSYLYVYMQGAGGQSGGG